MNFQAGGDRFFKSGLLVIWKKSDHHSLFKPLDLCSRPVQPFLLRPRSITESSFLPTW